MFDDEVHFEGDDFRSFVLVPWPNQPTLGTAQHRELDIDTSARVVFAALRDAYGNPRWRLLQALRIDQHPANMHPGDLARLVARRLEGARRLRLFEVQHQPAVFRVATARDPVAPRSDALPRTSWIAVGCIRFDDEKPVSGVRLELIPSDGARRTVRTDSGGVARLDRIPAGTVQIRVLDVDGRLWKPADGSASKRIQSDSSVDHVVVRSGETLHQIARKAGLPSYRDIWDHAQNAELRKKRGAPKRVIPGDSLYVPSRRIHEIDGSTERAHWLLLRQRTKRPVYALRSDDLTFHSGSCVFLGEIGDVTDPKTLAGASGIDALATALAHAREHPERSLLIAGHSDCSGDAEANEVLSEKRADALRCLLLGEREAWVEHVRERSTIADVQQILAWFSAVRGWPCAPFAVDGREGADNARIVRAFQAAYNHHYARSIAEDGVLGPETWGAIFEVYQEQLRYRLELDEAGLSALRQQLKFCAAGATHGHGSFEAIHAGARDEASARKHRRAEILFFEAGKEPTKDDLEPGPLGSPDFSVTNLEVARGLPLVWISVQTVDDLGARLPNVELVFASEGWTARETTDAEGVWEGQVRAGREIEVRRADGGELRLGSSVESTDHVTVRSGWAGAITDLVVVGTVDAEHIAAQRELERRYAAISASEPRSARGVLANDDALVGEPMQELPSHEGAPPRFTRRSLHSHTADNLFLAAKLELEALPEVIETFVRDYYPVAKRRGFFVVVLYGADAYTFSQDGDLIRRDQLAPGAEVHGRMGLYGVVQSDRVPAGGLFADLFTQRTVLKTKTSALECAEDEVAPPPPDVRLLEEIIDPTTREDFAATWRTQVAMRKVALAYFIPYAHVGTLVRIGGTGQLETYRADSALRRHIHERNLAVAESAGNVYRQYLKGFVRRIREIDTSAKGETAEGDPSAYGVLERIYHEIEGPPVFPRPARIREEEWVEILNALGDTTASAAYKAYMQKHNEIFGIRSAGAAWIAAKVSITQPLKEGVRGKVDLSFTADTDGLGRVSIKSAGNLPITQYAEVDIDQDGVVKLKAKGGALGPLEVQLASNGTTTVTYLGVSTTYNASEQQIAQEIGISLKDVVMKALTKRGEKPGEWVDRLGDVKLKAQIGLQLSKEEDVADALSVGPELPPIPLDQLIMLQWSTLGDRQHRALEELGFDQASWDRKELPESTKRPFDQLSQRQRLLIRRHLTTIPRGSRWEAFWSSFERRHASEESAAP